MENGQTKLGAGIVAGAIGGLFASWVMNAVMEGAGPKIQQVAEKLDPSAHHPEATAQSQLRNQSQNQAQSESSNGEVKEDATMKTADAVVSAVTGGRHLSFQGKQKGGPIVHYAFGALMGALYGATAEYSTKARLGFGTVFGAALFAGADLWAVPALHLSGSSSDALVSSLATPLTAHLVYGAATEGVRRLVRAAI
ncbi:MAG TPA: hypothetical protein VKB38_16790 [Terracidiphilus sp.]|nr:hypothetical protein [Terracidiphilus sp.]